MRAGMRLDFDIKVDHSGIGTGGRNVNVYLQSLLAFGAPLNLSGAKLEARRAEAIEILSDGSFVLDRTLATTTSYGIGLATSATGNLDMSLPWTADVWMQSAAETAVNIATSTWSAGVATYNTSAVHTLAVGDKTTIAGVSLAGYNGVVIVASIVDTDTFTVAMASDPGGSGTGGTSSRISNMKSQSYVLELIG